VYKRQGYDGEAYVDLRREIQDEAINLAERIENLGGANDNGLLLDTRIQKYSAATLAFIIAASAQDNKEVKDIYADKAIADGDKSMVLIGKARENARSGRQEDQKIQDSIERKKRREYVLYMLASAYAIKVSVGHTDLIGKTWKLINEIPQGYKDRYPLAGDMNLKWFIENNPE
jgi:hypothetical protein